MKKLFMTLIVSLALGGTIFAQHPTSYWDGQFQYSDYEDQGALYASIMINGEPVTTATPDWDVLEVAAFVGDQLRMIGMFLTDEYLEYDLFPTLNAEPIYYTTPGETVTFMMYNHTTGVLYEVCEPQIWDGDPITIHTGEEHWEGFDDPDHPLMLNFIGDTPEPPTPPTPVTFTKDIVGYGDESNARGFYLIASPIVEEVTPSAEYGFLTNAYDLYFFDGSYPAKEWRNFEDTVTGGYNLVSGKGYLYASKDSTTLTFTGTPYSGDGVVGLEYSDAPFGKWNLVGNPFADTATIVADSPYYFYVLNTSPEPDAPDFIQSSGPVPPMEGIFVLSTGENDSVTFSTERGVNPDASLSVVLTKSCIRGTIDRAVVRFGEGRVFPKFQMNPNHTKVYIPQDGTDYAVVSAPEMGEMPVNFKAETNGSYTMSFGSENVTFSYLHLIDNLTGADVDLLATPSYTFDATTTDYASRFRLVFATSGNNDGDSFAFFSNGSFVVSNEGEATLQVVDVMGRILKSENISGSASVKVDAASGVYMLRLVNGNDVKVQKVVVE